MCGINGIYRYGGIKGSDQRSIRKMNAEMVYRGPDDEGLWAGEKTVIGMRRLSIIGVKNGHQPMFNEDGSLVLVCNGEIYNYHDLKFDLEKKGHRFCSESDSEIILHLYEERGARCLDALRGMFAFALWDIRNQTLFMVRDRVGEKPLYFAEIPGGIVFSSELKAIRRHYLPEREIDWNIIRQIMEYTYPVDMRKTHISSINRLLPGEFALADASGVHLKKYWKPSFEPTYKGSFQNAREDFLSLLSESIRLRFQSEVPVAIMLSGGVDSSAVAALSVLSKSDVHAITVGYRGQPDCDERRMAQRLVQAKGIKWHDIELDPTDFEAYFNDYIRVLDEPVADPVCIPQWGIYRSAKENGFKVLLNGTGGDELFFGYPYHNLTARHLLTNHALERYLPLKPEAVAAFGQFFSTEFHKFSKQRRYLFKDPLTYLKPFENCWKTMDISWPDRLEYRDPDPLSRYLHEAENGPDQLSAILFSSWLPANCLHISDKLGMGNSVEVRAPFLDHKLIEFVYSLPVEWRWSDTEPKTFLKQALRGIVPDDVLDAPKKGFSTPDPFIRRIVRKNSRRIFPEASFHLAVIENVLAPHLSDREKTALGSEKETETKGDIFPTAPAASRAGEKRFQNGDRQGAIEAFHAALQMDPRCADALNNLGVIYWEDGDAAEALVHFKKAAEADPNQTEILQNLTDAQAAMGIPSVRNGRSRPVSAADPKDPGLKPLRIVFLWGGHPFRGDALENRPLGGTETALIHMARHLARLGHWVRVFVSDGDDTVHDRVTYSDHTQYMDYLRACPCDVLIAARTFHPFLHPAPARARIFWTGDAHDQPFVEFLSDPGIVSRIDRIFTVSRWQTRKLAEAFRIPLARFHVTRNGVFWDNFEKMPDNRNQKKLIYTSTPFRGLDVLLYLFPKIREKVPDAKLDIYSSMAVYGMDRKEDQERFGRLYRFTKQPGVRLLGSVVQSELAEALKHAGIFAYPNTFEETSCMAAMEAMAAGLPVVTSKRGALPETVSRAGTLISGDPASDSYHHEFVEAVCRLLTDEDQWVRMSEAGRQSIRDHHRWDIIAAEWIAEFQKMIRLSKRSRSNDCFLQPGRTATGHL